MKDKTKKISPIAIAVASVAVVGIIVALVLAVRLNNREEPPPPDIKTSQPVGGDLQDYDFPEFEPVWGKVAFPGEYNRTRDTLVDYAYTDEYFTIDSTIYNPSLSTMSLCLDLSAWASYDTDVWPEKTRNARKLLDELGFEDFAQNDFWDNPPSTKSIGVVAANKKLEDCTLIALPVRGGQYFNEWGSNVDVGITGEHTGFAEGRDNVVKFLEEYIVDNNITGRVKIWVVGFSRGAAVANLVAGHLNENELPNGATLAFEDLYCYAFEPPQGSLVELAGSDAEHSNIHNIVNPNDVVTMVAPVDWGFTRYNSTSRLLPTVTTAEFETALAVMLKEYEEIIASEDPTNPEAAEYNVSEYAKRIDVNVNPLNFLPSGDPMVDVQIVNDTSQTMNNVLTSFITVLGDSFQGREGYNTNLEADLVYLLDRLCGYKTGVEMDAVMSTVMETMTANNGENLEYVIAPLFAINGNSSEERADEVVARLYEVLPQPEGFTDLYGTAATLIEAVGGLIVSHPDEMLDIALAFTNSKVIQSHYEEVTLAWLRAGDPLYTDTPFRMAVPETLRTVRVNAPANVEIYDSEGNLVASIIDNVATTNNAVVGCAVNDDGEIIIHLPADAEYKIVTTATGDGELNVTLSEYNLVHSSVTRVQNYADIPVKPGDILTLSAPNLIKEEYTDEEQQGSTAEYKLSDNSGKTITCQSETRGTEIEYFGVNVQTDNKFGTVNGGGRYLEGSFAMVEAQPVTGSEFIGWYIGSELVSTEKTYRFAVDSDAILTARFSEVPLHALTFGTSGEGAVLNTDDSYSAGSRVQLSAEVPEGYEFDHWETTAGTIENASDPQTVFIVPDGDAAITAVYKGKICAACHKELANGESHAAGCGVGGHYTCNGGNHQALDCGHYSCNGGAHGSLSCGHYACDSGNHGTLPCGHYACAGGSHSVLSCGHYACDSGNHGTLSCGHYACETGDHGTLPCGHFACDSGSHGTLSCGHFACENGDHGTLPCGHYACDSGNHGTLSCGHYACAGGSHSELPCGHLACDSGNHGTLSCGHYACDTGNHGKLSCGHYACAGGSHSELPCGHHACDSGSHGELSCGHYSCDSGNHGKLSCGHYACAGGSHRELSCGHYACEGGRHGELSCGHLACDGKSHRILSCGHRACDGGNHSSLSCGHYACDSGDHGGLPCGHYACSSGDHGSLPCGHYACDSGDHGELPCGHLACDGGSHRELSCGHLACDGGNHDKLSCGHRACDGGDHKTLPCGHFACESGDHTTICPVPGCGRHLCDGHIHDDICVNCQQPGVHQLTCGHYSCDQAVSGMDHAMQNCGHYGCVAGDHTAGDCGTDGHYRCDNADHSAAPCGKHYKCDGANHSVASCGTDGHYACDGADHAAADCKTEGHYKCDGTNHAAADCEISGHYACDSGDHTQYVDNWEPCGHYKCDESVKDLTHELYSGCFDHFRCDPTAEGLSHTEKYDCHMHFKCDTSAENMYHELCNDCQRCKGSNDLPEGFEHGPDDNQCYGWYNYYCHNCKQNTNGYAVHLAECGSHYICDDSYIASEHAPYDCRYYQHYKCNPHAASLDHVTICPICGDRMCSTNGNEHGVGFCD